ncbi:MAG TPA: divalent-cation tolerance protein CutA [Chromatiaceae bacterium]|nr:divalent-cation tolerance protein CutA [Chromatiaceae bacterium]
MTDHAPPSPLILVFCSAPDLETADRLGTRLVEEDLAACVNLLPGIRSIYRWQGKLVRDAEVLLLIKTREVLFPTLAARLRELHPYDLPEIIACPISQGLPDYLEWVNACTSPVA